MVFLIVHGSYISVYAYMYALSLMQASIPLCGQFNTLIHTISIQMH